MLRRAAHIRSFVDHDGAVMFEPSRNAKTRLEAVGFYV